MCHQNPSWWFLSSNVTVVNLVDTMKLKFKKHLLFKVIVRQNLSIQQPFLVSTFSILLEPRTIYETCRKFEQIKKEFEVQTKLITMVLTDKPLYDSLKLTLQQMKESYHLKNFSQGFKNQIKTISNVLQFQKSVFEFEIFNLKIFIVGINL